MPYFFRHSLKLHKNGKRVEGIPSCPWDPPLQNPNHDDYLLKTVQTLPKIKRIIVSPFLRCRQTADLLKKYLFEFHGNSNIEIVYEPLLREFLGNWKNSKIYVDQGTAFHMRGSELAENSIHDLHRRMIEFDEKYSLTDEDCVVSHNLCITILARTCYGMSVTLSSPGFVNMSHIYQHCLNFASEKYDTLYLQLQSIKYTQPILQELGLKTLQDRTVFIGNEKDRLQGPYNFMIFRTTDVMMHRFIADLREMLSVKQALVEYDTLDRNRINYTFR